MSQNSADRENKGNRNGKRKRKNKSNKARKPYGVIRVQLGRIAGREIRLRGGQEVTLGREPATCALCFPTEGYEDVSRRHCTVRYSGEEGLFYVTDWSTHGVFKANGKQLPHGIPEKILPDEGIFLGLQRWQILLTVRRPGQEGESDRICPVCGYVMTHHEDICPKCMRIRREPVYPFNSSLPYRPKEELRHYYGGSERGGAPLHQGTIRMGSYGLPEMSSGSDREAKASSRGRYHAEKGTHSRLSAKEADIRRRLVFEEGEYPRLMDDEAHGYAPDPDETLTADLFMQKRREAASRMPPAYDAPSGSAAKPRSGYGAPSGEAYQPRSGYSPSSGEEYQPRSGYIPSSGEEYQPHSGYGPSSGNAGPSPRPYGENDDKKKDKPWDEHTYLSEGRRSAVESDDSVMDTIYQPLRRKPE